MNIGKKTSWRVAAVSAMALAAGVAQAHDGSDYGRGRHVGAGERGWHGRDWDRGDRGGWERHRWGHHDWDRDDWGRRGWYPSHERYREPDFRRGPGVWLPPLPPFWWP